MRATATLPLSRRSHERSGVKECGHAEGHGEDGVVDVCHLGPPTTHGWAGLPGLHPAAGRASMHPMQARPAAGPSRTGAPADPRPPRPTRPAARLSWRLRPRPRHPAPPAAPPTLRPVHPLQSMTCPLPQAGRPTDRPDSTPACRHFRRARADHHHTHREACGLGGSIPCACGGPVAGSCGMQRRRQERERVASGTPADSRTTDDRLLGLMLLGESASKPGVVPVHTRSGGRGLVLSDADGFPDAGCDADGEWNFASVDTLVAPHLVVTDDDGGWDAGVWVSADEGAGPATPGWSTASRRCGRRRCWMGRTRWCRPTCPAL
mgnify:CR=1 FL=1